MPARGVKNTWKTQFIDDIARGGGGRWGKSEHNLPCGSIGGPVNSADSDDDEKTWSTLILFEPSLSVRLEVERRGCSTLSTPREGRGVDEQGC